jgi:hypothetical protein
MKRLRYDVDLGSGKPWIRSGLECRVRGVEKLDVERISSGSQEKLHIEKNTVGAVGFQKSWSGWIVRKLEMLSCTVSWSC